MTAAAALPAMPNASAAPRPVWVLAAIEGRRFLRSVPFWAGAILTAVLWATTDLDTEGWIGSQYGEIVGAGSMMLYVGAFVAAALVGLRDQLGMAIPLVDATPVEAHERVLGRLLAGFALVAISLVMVALELGYLGQQGGIVVADGHTMPKPADIAMIPALVALAVASGIALGQLVHSRAVVIVGGSFVILMTTGASWVFGSTIDVLPSVINPQRVRLAPGFDPASAPASWVLQPPDEEASVWTRVSFEQAAIAWHLVYVVGLTLLLWALACRRHGPSRIGRILGIAGALATVTGGVLQFVARTGSLA